MKKFNLIISICFIACFAMPIAASQGKHSRPNIIFILADDLGYGDIAAFNPQGKIKTPHIDKLASQGIKFTDAHTSSSVCTPTRYGILTGRYNWRSVKKSSVLSGYSKALIPASRLTVASMLKAKNYNTAFIGKWHLGWDWAGTPKNIDYSKPITNGPQSLGFTYSFGHSGSLDMAPYVYVENNMPTAIPTKTYPGAGSYAFARKGPIAPDFDITQVTPKFFKKAEQYITQQAKKDKPFFLYLPLPSPHTPILPTKQFQGKSKLNAYADFVVMIDHHMGKLLKTVKDAGIEDNTIIIFTSDNGCSPKGNFKLLKSLGHNPSAIYRGHKADIFEAGHKVPFIVKWPAVIKPNATVNKTICTTDFLATIAQIVGHRLRDNQAEDSFSIMPLFNKTTSQDYARKNTIHSSIRGRFAITIGHYKLSVCAGSGGWSKPHDKDAIKQGLPPVQLYNLQTDPGETNNICKQYPRITKHLYKELLKTINKGRSTPGTPQSNDVNGNWRQLKDVIKLGKWIDKL